MQVGQYSAVLVHFVEAFVIVGLAANFRLLFASVFSLEFAAGLLYCVLPLQEGWAEWN